MESKLSADAKKEFPQHPDRVWDPPSPLFKGYRDSLSCHGLSSWRKRHQVGSGAHPSVLPMGTSSTFLEMERRIHETDHTAIQRDLKKPVHISCVIKHFIMTR